MSFRYELPLAVLIWGEKHTLFKKSSSMLPIKGKKEVEEEMEVSDKQVEKDGSP